MACREKVTKKKYMKKSVSIMVDRIVSVLADNNPSIYLFGSLVLDDFKLGWSDIDILCLTEKSISKEQAETLVNLRQDLQKEHLGNPYFRLFEGGLLSWTAIATGAKDTVVYWGTRGQKITDSYVLDPFSTLELMKYGRLLYGSDHRHMLHDPSKSEIITAVRHHYNAIRTYAKKTNATVSSCGWMLDIARCIYTLETWAVIAKTKAGQWALDRNLCPDKDVLTRVIEIRKRPKYFGADEATLEWMSTLGPFIQRFADVLDEKLNCLTAE